MGDAVKPWERVKPFKRINNEDVLARQNPAIPDGDGVACGCQLPADYPDLKQAFDDAFKNFKPGKLQRIIQEIQKRANQIGTALNFAAAIANPALFLAAQKATDLIEAVFKKTNEQINKLLSQIGLKLAERAIRVMPQWVPVLRGASNEIVTPDQVIEVEGIASRSFMNPVEVPFRQWHSWFNWNVHIVPEPGYNVIAAEEPPNTDGAELAEVPVVHNRNTISVQWDTGALWRSDFQASMAAGFIPQAMVSYDGPMMLKDWAWPMTNSYVWATGRWVYDCSRTTNDTPPKMCTMINPCKAIASARWQAFEFPENELGSFVPAIQFMFFACKRGGYIDFPSITDTDYEFIVDLPQNDLKPLVPFAIGHTPEFPHNTIVMRPRLLLNLDQAPFDIAGSVAIEPIVEIIRPDDPQKLPEQVKVRVPLTTLPADAEACGFILTMGWYDPTLKMAEKVKRCEVAFTHFSGIQKVRNSLVAVIRNELNQDEQQLLHRIQQEIGDIDLFTILGQTVEVNDIPILGNKVQELGARIVKELLELFGEVVEEDWLLRIGVNGKWQVRYIDRLKQSNIKKLRLEPVEARVMLSDDDLLALAANGAEFAPIGEVMLKEKGARTFQFDGKRPKWSEIVTPDADPARAREITQKMAIAYALELLGRGGAGFGLGRDNQPLGFMDPLRNLGLLAGPNAQSLTRNQNPIQVGVAGTGAKDEEHEQTMFFARALPEQKILVEANSINDYTIFYKVSINKQDDV